MTAFDRIFDECATLSGFSWDYLYGSREANTILNRDREEFPNILRDFSEPLRPLFDTQNRVARTVNLYIINLGFMDINTDIISEDITDGLVDIMTKFIEFRRLLKSKGIDVQFVQDPFPIWQQFDCNEYGYVYKLICTYSLCLS